MRKLWVAGVVALTAQLAGTEARADNWFDFGFLWPHHSQAYYADPYYMPARPRANLYGDPGAAPFDESYYNPTLDGTQGAPPPVRHKPVKHKATKAKPAVNAPTVAASTQGKTQTPSSSQTIGEVDAGKTASVAAADSKIVTASTSKPAALRGPAISCDKARQVVEGYGFSAVKPATCNGKVYAFNAVRDGKPYAIKLDAASGELTEVKKAQQ